MKLLFVFMFFISSSMVAPGQVTTAAIRNWVQQLSDPSDKADKAFNTFEISIINANSSVQNDRILQQLEQAGNKENLYFLVRLNLLRVIALHRKDYLISAQQGKAAIMRLNQEALQQAYQLNDDYLVATTSLVYFRTAKYYGEYEQAVMYGMYSAELYEKLHGVYAFPYYQYLGEMMYRVREYDKCISYITKFLNTPKRDTVNDDPFRMMALNNVALAYHRSARYDSAMYFYQQALALARQIKREDWVGIVSGNMGQVYYLRGQYDTAIALLEKDYRISIDNQYFDNAANSLQWAAMAYVAKGNPARALQQIWQSLTLIQKMPDEGYEQNIYKAAARIYQENGKMDSAIYYSIRYQALHDSLEKKINTSSVAISNIRLNEEKSRYNIQHLREEKKAQMLQRNLIIAVIILLAVMSILIVNRQRNLHKRRQEKLEHEKKLMEQEMSAARQQMNMFTQNIIEKTNLIEKLESQVQASNSSATQQETLAALSSLSILTEADWDNFKKLFEKLNPLFFQRLKSAAPDITVAEQRMAALTLLQLSARQMASMQGISPDSVYKMRQRLRQRLGVSNEINLEEYLKGV